MLDHIHGRCGVGNITLRRECAYTQRFNLSRERLSRLTTSGVIERDVRATAREFQRDSATDTARCTRNDRHASGKSFCWVTQLFRFPFGAALTPEVRREAKTAFAPFWAIDRFQIPDFRLQI